ncbi:MAG: DMT family transporter [Acidimicrobiales bacterium]
MSTPAGQVARTRLGRRDDIHVIAAVTAVCAWGIGPILNKSMSVGTPSIVFARMVVGVPLMVGMAYLLCDGLSRKLMRSTALPGILFSLSFITGFASIKMTSIVNATLMSNLQPVLVLLVAGRLFGERMTPRQLVYGATSLGGVLTVVLAAASTSGAHVSGDLMAAANVVIWTGYFLIAKKQRLEGVDSWSFLAAIFIWASVVVIPFGLIASNDLGQMTGRDWLLALGMAVGPGIVGHGLMTWSQSHVGVALASVLGLLSPVLSTSLAWIVFDQALTAVQLVGAAIVIVSLVLLVREQPTPAGAAALREEM